MLNNLKESRILKSILVEDLNHVCNVINNLKIRICSSSMLVKWIQWYCMHVRNLIKSMPHSLCFIFFIKTWKWDKQFKRKQNFREHISVEPKSCVQCDKQFENNDLFKQHVSVVNIVILYACEQCDKVHATHFVFHYFYIIL